MDEMKELLDRLESMPPGQERDRLWRFITDWLMEQNRAQTQAMLKINETLRESIDAMNAISALFAESRQS